MELAAIIQLTLGLISAASMGYAAWQRFRARQNQDGWELTDQSLRAVVAAIELLPSGDPRVQQAKTIIRSVSNGVGTEKARLAEVVTQVRSLLDKAGFVAARDETDPASIERAALAIQAARGKRPDDGGANGGKSGNGAGGGLIAGTVMDAMAIITNCRLRIANRRAGIAGVAILALALAAGCANGPDRMTKEICFPGASGKADELVIEWPLGVKAATVVTIDIQAGNGEWRAESVAPLPPLSVITTGTAAVKIGSSQ